MNNKAIYAIIADVVAEYNIVDAHDLSREQLRDIAQKISSDAFEPFEFIDLVLEPNIEQITAGLFRWAIEPPTGHQNYLLQRQIIDLVQDNIETYVRSLVEDYIWGHGVGYDSESI